MKTGTLRKIDDLEVGVMFVRLSTFDHLFKRRYLEQLLRLKLVFNIYCVNVLQSEDIKLSIYLFLRTYSGVAFREFKSYFHLQNKLPIRMKRIALIGLAAVVLVSIYIMVKRSIPYEAKMQTQEITIDSFRITGPI